MNCDLDQMTLFQGRDTLYGFEQPCAKYEVDVEE